MVDNKEKKEYVMVSPLYVDPFGLVGIILCLINKNILNSCRLSVRLQMDTVMIPSSLLLPQD
jgi:hypothetical protein